MPTYEYICDSCEHTFERFQSMSDEPVKTCPSCRKRKVRRLISAGAGVIFKGSGFHETDYRSDSYKAGAKAAEGECKFDPAGKSPDKCAGCPAAGDDE